MTPLRASLGLVCSTARIDHGTPYVIRVGAPYVDPEARARHAARSQRGPAAYARQDQALALRREKLTFAQIGALLEVSAAQAMQLARKAERREQAAMERAGTSRNIDDSPTDGD